MNEEVQEAYEDERGFDFDRPYPFTPQLQSQYCFLSPPDENRRLLVELANSIWVRPLLPHRLPSSDQLIQLLIGRYGGAVPNYSITPLKEGFLVKVPDWLLPDEPLLDANYWEQTHQIKVMHWGFINQSAFLPPTFRAMITIHDFPVDYWHPVYFRQATSAMGVIVAIPGEVLRGRNQGKVRLLLDCVDPKLIPHKLILGHGDKWTTCKVHLDGRPDQGDGAAPPPPPPEGGGRGNGPDSDSDEQEDFPDPYLPPWRRLGIQLPTPVIDPNRILAPAAQEQGRHRRSTIPVYAPGAESLKGASRQPRLAVLGKQSVQYGYSGRISRVTPPQKDFPHIQTKKISAHAGHVEDHIEGDKARNNLPVIPLLNPRYIRGRHFTLHKHQPLYTPTSPPSRFSQAANCPSILGAPPHIHTAHQSSPHSVMSQPRQEFTDADEALISKFIGLQTGENAAPKLKVPQSATTSTSWDLSLLLRVITDKTVLDGPFSSTMMLAWDVDPETIIRPVTKNLYLAEFTSEADLYKVSLGGPWTYRGDLVAHRRVFSHADLKASHIGFAHLWVQFHNLPVNCLTEEGIHLIAGELGTPVSPPVEGFVNGRLFVKVKVLLNISEPLADHVVFTHPTLGDLKVLCSYEKVNRLCRFCGQLGHEMSHCTDHLRLTVLMQDPHRSQNINSRELLAPKKGPWITNPILIPKEQLEEPPSPSSGHKRSFEKNRGENLDDLQRTLSFRGRDRGVIEEEMEARSSNAIKRPRPAGPIPLAHDP